MGKKATSSFFDIAIMVFSIQQARGAFLNCCYHWLKRTGWIFHLQWLMRSFFFFIYIWMDNFRLHVSFTYKLDIGYMYFKLMILVHVIRVACVFHLQVGYWIHVYFKLMIDTIKVIRQMIFKGDYFISIDLSNKLVYNYTTTILLILPRWWCQQI